MAIDTAAKRNSALLDPGNLPWPPDGSIAVADRLVMLEFYSGIAAAEPEQITIVDPWLPAVNDRNWQWNRLPDSNWEPVVSDRNWSAVQ